MFLLNKFKVFCYRKKQGQTLVEFAIAVPVLVTVFTLIFALGYAAYKAHSAGNAARGLDMQWDTLANTDDTPSIINASFAEFTNRKVTGPSSGFQVVHGLHKINVPWLKLPGPFSVFAYAVLPGDLLAGNRSSTASRNLYSSANVTTVYFIKLPLDSLKAPESFCDITIVSDIDHCISMPLTAKKFPKLLTMQDNCDTDLGVFLERDTDEDGKPMAKDRVAPADCFKADDPAVCRVDKLKHAAHYVTQFVEVADKNKGCVSTPTGTLFLKESEYPTFIRSGGY